jgi:ketosteroid isomerase-like protein
MSNHAADILLFDVANPLQYAGSSTVKKRAEEWFFLYRGPIGYEIRDLTIATGDDVAFCHYLYRASGTRTDGAKVDMWVRTPVCFRKINGTWILTHEHESVPFDPVTGKASLDLKP